MTTRPLQRGINGQRCPDSVAHSTSFKGRMALPRNDPSRPGGEAVSGTTVSIRGGHGG
jgi:hypothetical protein